MRFFYRISEDGGAWLAECEQMDAIGRGETPNEALDQLRTVLAERFDRPFAVAPPSDDVPLEIELVPLDDVYLTTMGEDDELSTDGAAR